MYRCSDGGEDEMGLTTAERSDFFYIMSIPSHWSVSYSKGIHPHDVTLPCPLAEDHLAAAHHVLSMLPNKEGTRGVRARRTAILGSFKSWYVKTFSLKEGQGNDLHRLPWTWRVDLKYVLKV